MSQRLPTLTIIDQTEGTAAELLIRAGASEVLFKGSQAAKIRKACMEILEGIAKIERGRGHAEVDD